MTMRTSTPKVKALGSLLFFLVGLTLFLPLLSINYDPNGISEAQAVEAGGSVLLQANHMLYRPLGWVFYQTAQFIDKNIGFSLPALQILTAIFSSIGLSLAFLVFMQINPSALRSALVTLGMAVSWSYWRFSTDVYYITVAFAFVALSVLGFLLATSRNARSKYYALSSGLACALAILLWQANIFLLLALGLGYLVLSRTTGSDYKKLALLTIGTAVLVVGLAYGVIGFYLWGISTPSVYLSWILTHPNTLSLWGHWGLDRVPNLLASEIASIVPVWTGLGLRDLLQGIWNPAKLLGQAALAIFIVLCLASMGLVIRYVRSKGVQVPLLVWLVASCASYLPFILWWDPYEPKWFVIPNFFLWAIVALVWGLGQKLNSYAFALLGAGVVIIGSANLVYSILPNHIQSGALLTQAECVSAQMGPKDLFLATDWSLAGYIDYVFHRQVMSSVVKTPSGTTLSAIKRRVSEVDSANGRVIMVNIASYSSEYLEWLRINTDLGPTQLSHFETSPAFSCNGTEFVFVKDFQPE